MFNLRYIEGVRNSDGPYEVTQLVNSFLAALAHPWEELKSNLKCTTLHQAAAEGWPVLKRERPDDVEPTSLGDLLRLVRNSFAHGNIEFLGSGTSEITHLRIWNMTPNTDRRTWGTIASVADMRQFLERFVELADELCASQTATTMRRKPA
jgi:hypothetical protein